MSRKILFVAICIGGCMDMGEKSKFAIWAGIIVAIIGLVTAMVTGGSNVLTEWMKGGHGTAYNPPLPQGDSQPPAQKQSKPDQNGSSGGCYLDGDWVVSAKGIRSEEEDYPVRFEHDELVFFLPQGIQIKTPCTVSASAITLQKPDSVQAASPEANSAGIVLALMPNRYEREAAGVYAGQNMGMTWTLRLR